MRCMRLNITYPQAASLTDDKSTTILFGAGRLDKGVHALEQSAHFECKKKIENLSKFVKIIHRSISCQLISS